MKEYVKVIFRGETYGSIRAPTTLGLLCSVLQVSPRAQPVLTLITADDDAIPKKAITSLDDPVQSGLYELVARRDILFDPSVDPSPHLSLARVKNKLHPSHRERQQDPETSSKSPQFPIPEDEMAIAIRAMLHVVGSIPPRYLKYNVVLANQVSEAIQEVERITRLMNDLKTRPPPEFNLRLQHSALPLSLAVQTTFFQYRVLQILYETWKTCWRRASPVSRYLSVSDLRIMDSIDVAEHYLNLLHSWRRIIQGDTWSRLQKLLDQEKALHATFKVTVKPKLYEPPPLDSGKHPRAWLYLARPNPSVVSGDPVLQRRMNTAEPLDQERVLSDFRKTFIDSMTTHHMYSNEELGVLLFKLMELDKHSRSAGNAKSIAYPTAYIRSQIQKEFRLTLGSS